MYPVCVVWALGERKEEHLFRTEPNGAIGAILAVANYYRDTLHAKNSSTFHRDGNGNDMTTLAGCKSLFKTPAVLNVRQYFEMKGPGVHLCIVDSGVVIVLHVDNALRHKILMRVWHTSEHWYSATTMNSERSRIVHIGQPPSNSAELNEGFSRVFGTAHKSTAL